MHASWLLCPSRTHCCDWLKSHLFICRSGAGTFSKKPSEPWLALDIQNRRVAYRIDRMTAAFPDALTTGYEGLIDAMKNDEKDRHVLACAMRSNSHAIVTSNKKHFPEEALKPYELECMTPDDFLVHQYHLDADGFIGVIISQAAKINRSPSELLASLRKHVPTLASYIRI
jgi:hypothetical protein